MKTDFKKMSSSRLEDIIYIPTENELREIAKILTDRNEEMIISHRATIKEYEGKNLTSFGRFCLDSAKEGLNKCLEKREQYNRILNK